MVMIMIEKQIKVLEDLNLQRVVNIIRIYETDAKQLVKYINSLLLADTPDRKGFPFEAIIALDEIKEILTPYNAEDIWSDSCFLRK